MIINQDCIDWMRAQPAESVDIVLTSPPYNFDRPYGVYQDNIDHYRAWQTEWITEACRIITDRGRFIINIQPKFSENKPYHHWIYQDMERQGMVWYGERIWQKNTIANYRGAAGSMGIPSKIYLWYSTEYVQIFAKGDCYRATKREHSLITIEEQVAWARDHIWSIAPARQRDHPAQMPLELAQRCLKLWARKGDLVYDPFAGAGTTLSAARDLGLDYIGTEIDAAYCALMHSKGLT